MEKLFTPEVLAPAGNLEKLKVAVSYGADALYLGGQNFGLRSAADNFTDDELLEGVEFAHQHNTKIYIVLNSFLHDKELDQLPPFVRYLEAIGVDGVIVSDLGVLTTVSNNSSLPIHLSTQASCLNSYAGEFWKKMGVKRLILGREVSVKEAAAIKIKTGLEVELFIHGSMCMTYSGNCLISNYTQGRDSNRGGCAHSCRFEYSIDYPMGDSQKTYFMSSKDLQGLRALPQFIEYGIDSIKIEGRMKGHLYVGTVTKVYADTLDYYRNNGVISEEIFLRGERELDKVVHRDYCLGSLIDPAGAESVYDEREHDGAGNEYSVTGYVIEVVKDGHILIEIKKAFNRGDMLEILPFKGETITYKADKILDLRDEEMERSRPGRIVKLPYLANVSRWNIVRTVER